MVLGDRLPDELRDEVVEVYCLPFSGFPRVEIRKERRNGKFYGHVYNHGTIGGWADSVAGARAEVSNGILATLMSQRREAMKKLAEIDAQIPAVSPANMACGDWMKQYLQSNSPTKLEGENQ